MSGHEECEENSAARRLRDCRFHESIWVWVKINPAGFSLCFHLSGFHFWDAFLTHSQIESLRLARLGTRANHNLRVGLLPLLLGCHHYGMHGESSACNFYLPCTDSAARHLHKVEDELTLALID